MKRPLASLLLSASLSIASTYFDLTPGVIREWVVFRGMESGLPDSSRVKVTILDSANSEWRVGIESVRPLDRSGDGRIVIERDTAILALMNLDSTVVSWGHTLSVSQRKVPVWKKPSCLFPLDMIDSLSLAEYEALWKKLAYTDIQLKSNALFHPLGFVVAYCNEPKLGVPSRSGRTFEPPFLLPYHRLTIQRPEIQSRDTLGVIRWTEPRWRQRWELREYKGRPFSLPTAPLMVNPREGESWVWSAEYVIKARATPPDGQGLRYLSNDTSVKYSLSIRVLKELPDSAGWLIRRMELKKDSLGGTEVDTVILRINPSENILLYKKDWEWAWNYQYVFGSHWSIPSNEFGKLLVGFLGGDFFANQNDSAWGAIYYSDHARCIEVCYFDKLERAELKNGVGVSGYFQGRSWTMDNRADLSISLVSHSTPSETSISRRDQHPTRGRAWLKQRLESDPKLQVVRVLTNGRQEVRTGGQALDWFKTAGVAYLVVRDQGALVKILVANP